MDDLLFHHVKKGKESKRVIMFPYLGGGVTSFGELILNLDDDVDVWVANPPGHLNSNRPIIMDLDSLIRSYYKEIKNIITKDTVLFGHSMGGIIVYYLSKYILSMKENKGKIKSIILSACGAPCVMENRNTSELPNDELLEKLKTYGILANEILEEKELMEMLIPVFRADYKILEQAAMKSDEEPLDENAFIIFGENDLVTPMSALVKWLRYLKNGVKILQVKDSSHMFVHTDSRTVGMYIDRIINDYYVDDDEF